MDGGVGCVGPDARVVGEEDDPGAEEGRSEEVIGPENARVIFGVSPGATGVVFGTTWIQTVDEDDALKGVFSRRSNIRGYSYIYIYIK